MNDPVVPVQRTHVDVRREAAEGIAKDLSILFGLVGDIKEEIIERLEKMLIMGETRGVNEVKQRLALLVMKHRERHTDGVANHIEQALTEVHRWHTTSADFLCSRELKEAKEAGLVRDASTVDVTEPSRIITLDQNSRN
jgi:hypothetical protein